MKGVRRGAKVFLILSGALVSAVSAHAENASNSVAVLATSAHQRIANLEMKFLSSFEPAHAGKDPFGTSYAVYEYFAEGAHVKLSPKDADAGLKWARANPGKAICRVTTHASKGAALPALSGKMVVNLAQAKTVRQSKADRKVILDSSHDASAGMAELGLHFRHEQGRVGLVCFRAGARRLVLEDLSAALRDRVAFKGLSKATAVPAATGGGGGGKAGVATE